MTAEASVASRERARGWGPATKEDDRPQASVASPERPKRGGGAPRVRKSVASREARAWGWGPTRN